MGSERLNDHPWWELLQAQESAKADENFSETTAKWNRELFLCWFNSLLANDISAMSCVYMHLSVHHFLLFPYHQKEVLCSLLFRSPCMSTHPLNIWSFFLCLHQLLVGFMRMGGHGHEESHTTSTPSTCTYNLHRMKHQGLKVTPCLEQSVWVLRVPVPSVHAVIFHQKTASAWDDDYRRLSTGGLESVWFE